MTTTEKLSLDSFSPVAVLGKGSYATVLLAELIEYSSDCTENIDAPELYALKMMTKLDISCRGIDSSVYTEKRILRKLRSSPFVVDLMATFQTDTDVCYLLEYCSGGDLFELMKRKNLFTEVEARNVISQVLSGLEDLHQAGVVFRDLKPENLLIDYQGFFKLADFGRSVDTLDTEGYTTGFSGTPEYMAPEMVSRSPYSFASDWWSLGCLLFELLTGRTPFAHKSRSSLYKMILKDDILLPDFLSAEVKDLLTQLLDKDPMSRLGADGAETIRSHAWFKDVDFSAVRQRKVAPFWTPETLDEFGLQNFNKKFVQMDLETLDAECFGSGKHFENFYFEAGGEGDESIGLPHADISISH